MSKKDVEAAKGTGAVGEKRSYPTGINEKPIQPGGGGDQRCVYDGREFSGGSTLEMPAPGGKKVVKTCNGNTGRWE
jgi:hypothetical protein